MAHPATYDDVKLILQLYEMRREPEMRKAREWFMTAHASSAAELLEKYPPGSDGNRYLRMVTSHWEMVASFIVSGVLSPELFFQSGREMLLVWEKLRPMVNDIRTKFQDQTQYRNLESVAQAYIAYWERESPGAYAAFQQRVQSMRG